MTQHPTRIAFAAAALAAACALPVHAAGSVDVTFAADPNRYSDAGRDPNDVRRNEEALARHLQALGAQWLPDGQQLKVDVIDLDLAGRFKLSHAPGFDQFRIARGGADTPSIRLRYTLSEGGRVVTSGEETVTDLNYLRHGADIRDHEPLRNEKRMLEGWFKSRIVERKPAA